MNRLISTILLAIAAFCPTILRAQDDFTDAFIRENPEMESSADCSEAMDYSQYPFLRLDANAISLNGADWSALRRLFANSGDTVVPIVHIGDSHIQAEGSTTRTRSLLQARYGSAGRGLVIPFKLAGTNEPMDYSITSASRFVTSKLLKQPWEGGMGFTGISLKPAASRFGFTISVFRRPGSEPDFDFIRVFFSGNSPRLTSALAPGGAEIFSESYPEEGSLAIYLEEPQTEVTLNFEKFGDCQVHGFELGNNMTGVVYSAIGNNGATFASYNNAADMGLGIAPLNPALVILSLGTNEAFGKVSEFEMRNSIDKMVTSLRQAVPGAAILLTTPAECQRSKWVRSGKKKRRVRTYAVNSNVKTMRDAIMRYAEDNGIACYDWYEVAGGDGSSAKWLRASLLGKDRIHDTWAGYSLAGSLLYDALVKAIEAPDSHERD